MLLYVIIRTIILLQFLQILVISHLIMASLFEMIYVKLHGIVQKFSKSPSIHFPFPLYFLSKVLVDLERNLNGRLSRRPHDK